MVEAQTLTKSGQHGIVGLPTQSNVHEHVPPTVLARPQAVPPPASAQASIEVAALEWARQARRRAEVEVAAA